VLATWRGSAADAFRSRWEDWSAATAGVVAELAVATQALDLARGDLAGGDVRAADVSDRLGGRLA
jgi:uncharacterized protein YukE